ncbi:chemotaxis protein CheW [Corallococcus macrosporus]|uniref:Chemotaxis protein W n=2 Tax=Myxococcaceae TaxID=31 RepID=A0A250K4M4_9BACT|nr:chemotaxis protein CheW [Corallococcus macrosporus]AEI64241.1 putative chemotaxis protein CheW [Corallococcus macrosporus]ATB50995.1 chemotaxis protein W [Corallococcus macrosporus DSM 14697]
MPGSGGIDWEATRARLARLADLEKEQGALSPEEATALLEARARSLAREPRPEVEPGTLREVVRFKAGGQRYALESRFVLEVARAPELVALPGAPPALRGLTLMHGEVLPVVELAPLFGRPPSDTPGPLLVVGAARAELGVRTEEVEEVTVLAGSELLEPPSSLDDVAGHLVSAADRDGTLILEGEALLGDSRLMFELSDEGAV